MLETSRVNEINNFYIQSEMDLLDQRIQKEAFDIVELDCDKAVQANIDFADKIFEDARKIQRFEEANRLNTDIIFQHKRFDLLRTLFWINSIKIKQNCNAEYHNVVYFYVFNDPTIEQKARQSVFSNFLVKIKEEQGNNIMLVPIAADNDLPSVDLLISKYGIDELPVILIDEEFLIYDIQNKSEIQDLLD